jgi:metallo-beta-lactamase family protein
MNITFCGASKIVTGSCYLVEAGGRKILVDCGMFQGSKDINRLNYEPFRFKPRDIALVLLTHAHIDHSGLLPRLVREGFAGEVLTTPATADLCTIMLEDSARIQEMDTEHENRRRLREGLEPRKPLYSVEDARRCLERIKTAPYDERVSLGSDMEVRFRDAGHILGSAMLELDVSEGGGRRRLVFSGDVGQWDVPIIRNPTMIEEADVLFIESTYGDRLHEGKGDREAELLRYVKETYEKGGRLMIPSFAIERTQELIYSFKKLMDGKDFPDEKIYLDSPLAIKATEVFKRHRECFDEEALTLFEKPLSSPRIEYCVTAEDSMRLNTLDEPCIVIAGSGMCTGGRIRHHFKHGLWNSKNTVLFVGYQANGSLGRIILDGAGEVKMMGMKVVVNAAVGQIGSFSAHADYGELVKWSRGFRKRPSMVYVVHGEEEASAALKQKLEKEGLRCHVPSLGESRDMGKDIA